MAGDPTGVTVRMYQVGFGDCFLLSVRYGPAEERHVLIDFGQKSGVRRRIGQPAMGSKALTAVARDIADRVGDAGLAGIVVSHRHEDHVSGFGVDEAAGIIADLKPRAVLRSWTEDPKAPVDKSKAAPPSHRYMAGLGAANDMAAMLATAPFALQRTAAGRELRRLAAAQIPNAAAIAALDAMGGPANGGQSEFLAAAGPGEAPTTTALAGLLPGVRIDVLGPPRPEVWPDIARQREDDPDYWIAMHGSLGSPLWTTDPAAADDADDADDEDDGTSTAIEQLVEAGPARWLVERLRNQQARSLLRIVRWLDRSLNNTSVILLFTIGERRLLFPGDAQIENWLYAIEAHPEHERIWDDLGRLDLYKVGHHGSRNATPKRLYRHWRQERRDTGMVSLMSTLKDVYGETDGTRVPNGRLVTALKRKPFVLLSTEQLAEGALFIDVPV
jgi:hypothetical protein